MDSPTIFADWKRVKKTCCTEFSCYRWVSRQTGGKKGRRGWKFREGCRGLREILCFHGNLSINKSGKSTNESWRVFKRSGNTIKAWCARFGGKSIDGSLLIYFKLYLCINFSTLKCKSMAKTQTSRGIHQVTATTKTTTLPKGPASATTARTASKVPWHINQSIRVQVSWQKVNYSGRCRGGQGNKETIKY